MTNIEQIPNPANGNNNSDNSSDNSSGSASGFGELATRELVKQDLYGINRACI